MQTHQNNQVTITVETIKELKCPQERFQHSNPFQSLKKNLDFNIMYLFCQLFGGENQRDYSKPNGVLYFEIIKCFQPLDVNSNKHGTFFW